MARGQLARAVVRADRRQLRSGGRRSSRSRSVHLGRPARRARLWTARAPGLRAAGGARVGGSALAADDARQPVDGLAPGRSRGRADAGRSAAPRHRSRQRAARVARGRWKAPPGRPLRHARGRSRARGVARSARRSLVARRPPRQRTEDASWSPCATRLVSIAAPISPRASDRSRHWWRSDIATRRSSTRSVCRPRRCRRRSTGPRPSSASGRARASPPPGAESRRRIRTFDHRARVLRVR